MSAETDRPCDHVALYDDDCGFCRWSLDLLLARDRDHRVRPVAIQSPEGARLLASVPDERRLDSWHLIAPGGGIESGGSALPHLFELLQGGRTLSRAFRRAPRLTDRGYRWIARHRSLLSRVLPVRRDVDPRPC